MADTLESLEIKVQHSASGADAEINGVASAISNLKSAINGVPASLKELAAAVKACKDAFKGGFTNFNKLGDALANIAVGSNELGSSSNDVMTLANAMNALAGVKITAGSFNALASGVEKVGVAAQAVTPEAIENLDKMVTSLAKLQGVDLSGLGSALSAVRRVGNIKPTEAPMPVPVNIQEMIMAANQIDILEAKLESLRVALQEAFAAGDMNKAYSLRGQILQTEAALEKARASAKGAAEGVKELSKEASKSKGPLENFVDSLKRIAFYRFIRTIIKAITQAFQEGLQNAYAFSQGITTEGHRFAAALDSMKTAGTTMKNQLGSAFIALLAAIAPIINAIIGLITRLANALSQIFAIFTGGTYLKATEMPQQWGDAASGAAEAAEEWKNQILGFDEINRLEAPSDGGGGGGGGGLDIGSMFEDTPIEGIFAKIKAKLDELINSLDFGPLIKAWERLKDAVKGFADVVMDYLAWAWDNILVPLAHWVIEEAAPRLVTLLATAFEFLTAALEALKPVFQWVWDNVFKPIAEFVGDAFLAFLDELIDLFEDLTALLSGKMSFSEFINQLDGVQVAILGVCIALGVSGLIGLFTTLVNNITTGVFLVFGKLATVLSSTTAGVGLLVAGIVLLVAGLANFIMTGEMSTGTFYMIEAGIMAVGVALSILTGSWIPLAIAAVVAAVAAVIKYWDQIVAAIRNFQQILRNALNDGKVNILDFAAVFVNAIMAPINALVTLIQWIASAISWLWSLVSAIRSASSAMSSMSSRSNSGNYGMFASGGYPDEGQMFIAREAGPEMVGTVGGRTAVATNNDIVAAVSQGVANAVSAVMGTGGNSKGEVVLNINGREFARAIYDDQRAVNREHGTRLVNNV